MSRCGRLCGEVGVTVSRMSSGCVDTATMSVLVCNSVGMCVYGPKQLVETCIGRNGFSFMMKFWMISLYWGESDCVYMCKVYGKIKRC